MQGHYIRHNSTSQLPTRFVTFDTEAVEQTRGAGERIQRFRLAVTCRDTAWSLQQPPERGSWAVHDTPESLWAEVDHWQKERTRTVLVAHNLAYDLRVGQAFTWLPAMGWECRLIRLDHGQAWASWRKGSRSLVMVDSLSWVPGPLAELAKDVGSSKLRLPAWEDDYDRWVDRCRRDVLILRQVWGRVMGWLAAEDMGNWKPTGAGQAWQAWRHRFMPINVMVHPDPDLKALEREASWAGRTEVWRWGKLPKSTYTEWDWAAAYATLARDVDIPVVSHISTGKTSVGTLRSFMKRYNVLAKVTVTTDMPLVPARGDKGILWPVGTFDTLLWDPELSLLLDRGQSMVVHRVWTYRRAPALREWAEWVLEQLALPLDQIDPIVRRIVKHWSRALIGKFGTMWRPWEDYGEAFDDSCRLYWASDVDLEDRFRILTMGGKAQREGTPRFSVDSAPQVVSYICSAARRRVWETMEAAGLENVVYVDTDSIVTNRKGSSRLEDMKLVGLRPKRQWERLELFGPRQMIGDGTLSFAGVPRGAVARGDGRWEGESWSTLAGSLAAGEPDGVSIRRRVWHVSGTDHRRTHLMRGRTAPIVMP